MGPLEHEGDSGVSGGGMGGVRGGCTHPPPSHLGGRRQPGDPGVLGWGGGAWGLSPIHLCPIWGDPGVWGGGRGGCHPSISLPFEGNLGVWEQGVGEAWGAVTHPTPLPSGGSRVMPLGSGVVDSGAVGGLQGGVGPHSPSYAQWGPVGAGNRGVRGPGVRWPPPALPRDHPPWVLAAAPQSRSRSWGGRELG